MGQKITLDTTFTDPTLPKFYPHRLMNAGSLFLLNFDHPDGALSGVPANGATINNIAWETAAALIGGGATQAELKATVINTIVPTTGGLMEITPKKGLHGIITQVNDVSSGNDFHIVIPQKVREYIHANIGHGIYVSIWQRLTRLHTQSTASDMMLLLNNTGNYAMSFERSGNAPSAAGSFLGRRTTPTNPNTLGNLFRSIAVNSFTGAPTNTQTSIIKWGSGAAYAGFELNKASSFILYEVYIEDLTASGRTYAQADAADYALWQEAFAPGGPFNGDTFTDPATLA